MPLNLLKNKWRQISLSAYLDKTERCCKMLERILIAGSGGQGIILIGKLFASVAVRTIKHVTFFPAYGAEVRGGTSSCEVVLSNEEIASPVSESFDSMIIMNQDSIVRFAPRKTSNSLILLNSSMCKPLKNGYIVTLPASELAVKLGDIRIANFIMLGAFLSLKKLIPPFNIEDQVRRLFSERDAAIADMNIRAFRLGLEIIKEEELHRSKVNRKNAKL